MKAFGRPLFLRALPLWVIVLYVAAQSMAQPVPAPPATANLTVTVSKSLVLDSPQNIERVSVANGDMAEAVVINPREVMVNGKASGDTSLIIWQQGGTRTSYNLMVRPSTTALDAVQAEIRDQLPGQEINVDFQNNTAFLKGTAKDLLTADRAVAIAGVLGRVVNLLNVVVPPSSPQILLKVRFADVDRSAVQSLGVNIASLGATNTIGTVSTGQFSPPTVTSPATGPATLSLTNALNVFLFRRDLNLAGTIEALEGKNLLQILAEPNVLTLDGNPASFLAGGEFPYPTLQGGGGGLGAVTIQFREFGVRINFTPRITPRGTIRLDVTPEVSSLDFANGLIFQGFTIPGLNTRRIHTQIELEEGQSFVIAGLLDQRTTDALSKIPGLGDIPLLGKLFQSRNLSKSRSELLVLVTPEVVRPIPAGAPRPDLDRPLSFLTGAPPVAPQTPGIEVTGPVPARSAQTSIPIEQLVESQKPLPTGTQPSQPSTQFLPIPVMPMQSAPAPAAPAPAAPSPGTPQAN